MALNTESVQLALADFVDNRVMTAISDDNTAMKWMIGGVSTIGLARLKYLIHHYRPVLLALGFIDQEGNFCLEVIERFMNSAFQKQETLRMPLLGMPFKFDRTDGAYLIEALRRHGSA